MRPQARNDRGIRSLQAYMGVCRSQGESYFWSHSKSIPIGEMADRNERPDSLICGNSAEKAPPRRRRLSRNGQAHDGAPVCRASACLVRWHLHGRKLGIVYALAYTVDMLTILRSETFTRWLRRLRDAQARTRINARLRRVETTGNLGDAHSVGNGILEMRFHFGPGYRVYFIRDGAQIVVLLCGGDKDSQETDIRRAEHIATEWRKLNDE